MKLKNRTILLTGGTSGMGLELAKQLLEGGRHNTVIITGRSDEKLERAKRTIPGVHIFKSDVGDPAAIASLRDDVIAQFPALDTLINNAGIMRVQKFNQDQEMEDITREIEVCFAGPVRMVQQFMPHLKTRKGALLINVSSGAALIPFPISPVYSASKAAIHSFTESLRIQMKSTDVTVVELIQPGVETPLYRSEEFTKEMKMPKGMEARVFARKAIAGIEAGKLDLTQARELLTVRFWGVLAAVKHGCRKIAQDGSITLTSGMLAHRPRKGSLIATALAGAVEHLTRGLAMDLAPVRVNAVCPGLILTDHTKEMPEAMVQSTVASAIAPQRLACRSREGLCLSHAQRLCDGTDLARRRRRIVGLTPTLILHDRSYEFNPGMTIHCGQNLRHRLPTVGGEVGRLAGLIAFARASSLGSYTAAARALSVNVGERRQPSASGARHRGCASPAVSCGRRRTRSGTPNPRSNRRGPRARTRRGTAPRFRTG